MAPSNQERWVRLYHIFDQSVVPPESAEVIQRAVDKAVEVGDVRRSSKWQIIELWAADYLAGAQTDYEHDLEQVIGRANEEAPPPKRRKR
jgi:hypothetical protein